MALIDWTEELAVGIASIDEQHQRLVGIINALHLAMLERREQQVLGETFAELVDYTKTHFAFEERLFAEHGYPAEESHLGQHRALAQRVIELKEDFDSGNTAVTLEVMRFLREWLTGHILDSDKEYVSFLRDRGVT